MRHALPPRESRLVERGVFALLALGLGLVALLHLVDNARALGLDAAPRPPPSAGLPVLGLLFLAFVVSFALVAAGTLPRGRRARLAAALGCIVLAGVVAPMTFFHGLPAAWQEPDVFYAFAMLPPVAIGLALGLAAPEGARRGAWAGTALLTAYAALNRVETALSYEGAFASQGAYRAWRIVPALALLAGMAVLAGAYGAGAVRGTSDQAG